MNYVLVLQSLVYIVVIYQSILPTSLKVASVDLHYPSASEAVLNRMGKYIIHIF